MANATLTHMIKMAEPLCTMLGMMMVGQSELDFKLMVIMMLVIVSAFGSQPAASNIIGSATGILMALGSNTFYASRNIGSKTSKENCSTTLAGFTNLSLSGVIALLPLLAISLLIPQNDESDLSKNRINILAATSSISHCVYSLLSLAVILAVFNPIQVWPLFVHNFETIGGKSEARPAPLSACIAQHCQKNGHCFVILCSDSKQLDFLKCCLCHIKYHFECCRDSLKANTP